MAARTKPLRWQALLLSWMASVLWAPGAILVVGVSQGLAAVAVGCQWIGLCVPLHRSPWALVNQPGLAFSASGPATAYWLAPVLLPLLVALLAPPLLPRDRDELAELLVVLMSWWLLVVAVAWSPVLETTDGHLVRWLALNGLPAGLVWSAAVLAAVAAIVPTLGLLSLIQRSTTALRRRQRLAIVLLHLAAPTAGWIALGWLAAGSIPARSAVAAAGPVLVALVVAWVGAPRRRPDALGPPSFPAVATVLAIAVLLWGGLAVAGRPLPDGRVAAVQWSKTNQYNNIRSWIRPLKVLSAHPTGRDPAAR